MQTDTPYQNLGDIINDELFPELDSRLRRGEHIDSRHTKLFNILNDASQWLGEYYHRYGVDLIHTPEDFYYLKPGNSQKQLIKSRKLDELTMVCGQVLALYHMDPEQLEGSGWISLDAIYERLRLLLDDIYLCKLLERRKLDTQADRDKGLDTLRKAVRQLARLGMIRLENNQTNRVQTQSPLMRFIDPVRTAPCSREALEKLVTQGFISLDEEDDSEPDNHQPPVAEKQEDITKEAVEA